MELLYTIMGLLSQLGMTSTLTGIFVAILVFSLSFVVASSYGRPTGSARTGTSHHPTHLLIVLGSGGHTEEMLSVLRGAGLDFGQQYNRRTYVVSSGDAFSAKKAIEFEKEILLALHTKKKNAKPDEKNLSSPSYGIVIVPRARKVHQSFLTAPWTTLHCLLVCLHVLQGRHPNQHWVKGSSTATTTAYGADYPGVILTNGPGTAVCVIVAARILRLLNILLPAYLLRLLGITPWHGTSIAASGQRRYLRTVFVESWARVTTLSLSGKIVLPMVDRFLVQWEPIAGYRGLLGGKTEFAGTLVC